jgi:diguanylate cyclase (GGDEF)-like protein
MSNRRKEIVLGLVIPLAVIVGLAFVGRGSDLAILVIAAIAVVPLFASLVAGPAVTGVVALVAVLAASATAASALGKAFSDAIPVLLAVILAAGAAVILSRYRTTRPPRRDDSGPAPSPRPSASDPDTDDVTGRPTREAAARVLGASVSTDPRVVALIDCDALAAMNETYGRQIGDEFLFAVAGRTVYALSSGDTVARWDDDELLVVMASDGSPVVPTLELITDKVNKNPIRTASGLVAATISVGAALWPAGADFDDAVGQARAALASAKAQGPGHLVVGESMQAPRQA